MTKLSNTKHLTPQAIILFVSALLLLSRFVCISHNMYLHADEHVFFKAANSMTRCFFGLEGYTEIK